MYEQNIAIDKRDTESTLTNLRDAFYDCAKRSKVQQSSQRAETVIQSPASNDMSIATNNSNEHAAWASLVKTRDPKLIWERIE